MEQAYSLDRAHQMRHLPAWIPGRPEKSFWFGMKEGLVEQQIPIAVFRCMRCGFLESYARREYEPE